MLHTLNLKAGSQYSVRVASRPEVIIFSMGLDAARRRNRIRFYYRSHMYSLGTTLRGRSPLINYTASTRDWFTSV